MLKPVAVKQADERRLTERPKRRWWDNVRLVISTDWALPGCRGRGDVKMEIK